MSLSFKKYADFVSKEGELSDEQINEIFGIFKNNDKLEKLKAEKEKLKKETAKKMADWKEKKELEAAAKNAGAKNMQGRPSLAASGRAAERDWVGGMNEGVGPGNPANDYDAEYDSKANWKKDANTEGYTVTQVKGGFEAYKGKTKKGCWYDDRKFGWLNEAPVGKDWKVQYMYADPSGSGIASGTITIRAAHTGEQAKELAKKQLARKKLKDLEITRATLMKAIAEA